MRFSKIALVAAACALTSQTAYAQVQPVTVLGPAEEITVDTTIFNPAGGGTIAITPGVNLVLFSEYATTVDAAFLELGDTDAANLVGVGGSVYKVDALTGLPTGGNVIKRGGGVLQINSWTTLRGTQRAGSIWWMDTDGTLGYAYQMTINSHFVGADSVSDLQPSITDDPDGRNATRLNGLQGSFTVDQGTVRLAGYLNVWHDQGDNDTIDPFGPIVPPPPRYTVENADAARLLAPRMTGVSAIVLNGSSVLELTNAPLNIPTGASTSVGQGSALRVQYLRNLQAGLANDQLQTELVVGTTSEYRALIHIEQDTVGSIGILAGAGNVVKSGAGDFIILNESRLTGSFTVSGGRVILDSADGRALASASSVNLAGQVDPSDRAGSITSVASTASRRGAHVRYLEQEDIDVNGDGAPDALYKPAYAPEPGTRTLTRDVDGNWTETLSGAELEIRGDQTIRNFQADFALSAAPDATTRTAASAIQRAADVTNRGELVIAGTGVGASVILGGHTLTIQQDAGRDGFFEGSILGGFDFTADLATEAPGTYTVSFDQTPDFGTFQMTVTDANGISRLTDATDISSAAEIRANVASALGVAESTVTVTDATAELGSALGWRIQVGTGGSVDATANLRSGRVVLDATDDAAKLALILSEGTFAETEARNGSLIVNAQGLGTSRINVSSGELRIFQADTATLEASLLGAGVIRVVASAEVDNGSGTPIEINSDDSVGTLNFGIQQRGFRGELIVNDGVDVSLSAVGLSVTDTLINASAITLDGGTSGRGSTLRFNDTDQLVRNLSGDALSRIELGRGTMTLVQESSARTFLGTITGVGSVLKRGSGNFNFRGVDDLGVNASDFTGALAVQQGSVSLGSANALRNVSGVVLLSGTSVTTGGRSQRIAALFGEAGSTFNLGAATLTVGVTPARQADLRQQLETSFGLQLTLSHNYLGTTEAAYDLLRFDAPLGGGNRTLTAFDLDRAPLRLDDPVFGGVPTELDFLDGTLGMADQTRLYLERVAYRLDRDGDGTVSTAEADLAAASAATLGFSGQIVASGANQSVAFGGTAAQVRVSLSKTGWETLRLLNDNTGTSGNQFGGGAIVVRQGTLEVTPNALDTAGSIVVLANSSTIDLDGDGVTEAVALDDGEGNTVFGVDLNEDGFFDDLDRVADGTLGVNVSAGTATWSNVIVGDGNFAKTGAGTLVLDPTAAQYTGSTIVAEGTLDLTLLASVANPANATLGDVAVADGATLLLRTPASFTAASSIAYVAPEGVIGIGVDDLGNFTKAGLGTLVVNGVDDGAGFITPRIMVGGTIRVQEGVLAVDSLPNFGFFQTLQIDADAEFRLTLGDLSDEVLAAEITGSGTFSRRGTGFLLISQDPDPAPLAASAAFTGTLELRGGITELELPGSLPNASLHLVQSDTVGDTTTLQLGAGAYAFAGLTGERGTVIDLLEPPGGTTLTLTVASGIDSFVGRFTGFGDLVKEGAGSLRLTPLDDLGDPIDNEINDFTVNAGRLIATVAGLGNANSVTINANGTLEFESTTTWEDRTQPAPAEITYTADITGTGKLSKSGTGDILLSGDGALPSGDISVLEGTLIVDDRRVGSTIPTVAVSSGATFELLLTADRSLTNQITGAGGFSVNGGHLLTVLNQPTYTGLTRLRNDADLIFDAGIAAPVLYGLAADATDNVVELVAGTTLTVIQSTAADFAGQFSVTGGNANLVVQGTAAFRYTANNGNLSTFGGTVVVDGGILQVGLGNTKSITLTDGGTLQIFADLGADDSYDGAIVIANSSSELVKLGEGTLDLTAGLPNVTGAGTFERLRVEEGMARVAITAGGILGVNKLAVSGTGSLELSVASGTATITDAITAAIANGTGGSLTKTGAGTLVLVAGITTEADITVANGVLQLGSSAASGCQVAGDVTVNSGASLTGSGTIQGGLTVTGTFAPGYSPGTVTVAGALSFGAASTYAVEVSDSASDTTLVSGSLSIAPGATLYVTGWDNPATASVVEGGTPGDRHAIVVASGTATVNPAQRFTNLTTTAYGTASPQSLGYLVAYPGDTLGRANEINVYVTRATQAGALTAASLAPGGVTGIDPAFIARLSELARVEVDGTGVVTDLTSGAFGQRLAILSPTDAPGTIRSLTGLSYLAGLGMAHFTAAGDAEEIARRLEQRRFDRGYMSVKPREFFVTATSGNWKAGSESHAPNYDINRTGALAGYDRDLGPDSVIGWALALDRSKADLAGGGSIDSTHARVMGYFSTMIADETAYVEAGASVGYASMDAVRTGASLGATSSPSAFTATAWTRLGSGLLLAPRTSFSPFVQLDISYAKQGGVTETGDVDTALTVDVLRQTAVRSRAGFSLAQAWDSDRGDWRYRLSLDVAYVASLSGEELTTTAQNGGLLGAGGDITAAADPLDRGGLIFSPAFTFGPDNDTTYSVSTEFRRLGGGDATSINLTYRRRF